MKCDKTSADPAKHVGLSSAFRTRTNWSLRSARRAGIQYSAIRPPTVTPEREAKGKLNRPTDLAGTEGLAASSQYVASVRSTKHPGAPVADSEPDASVLRDCKRDIPHLVFSSVLEKPI